uniref:hypothetical protein n=1 Tax=uncultured Flavonifractor sp. TaxID=1193534 RepID=UPI002603D172
MVAAVYDPTGQRRDIFGFAANRSLSNLTAPQTALYNLGAGVRPSHLINGDFTVNQEKWTGTPSAENQ